MADRQRNPVSGFLFVSVIVLVVWLVYESASHQPSAPLTPGTQAPLQPPPRLPVEVTPRPVEFDESLAAIAVETVEQYELVRDAAISHSREPGKLNLALIVNSATTPEKARDLGDSFVRLAISFIENGSPQKEIGPSTWSYCVNVADSQDNLKALGCKSAGAHSITW